VRAPVAVSAGLPAGDGAQEEGALSRLLIARKIRISSELAKDFFSRATDRICYCSTAYLKRSHDLPQFTTSFVSHTVAGSASSRAYQSPLCTLVVQQNPPLTKRFTTENGNGDKSQSDEFHGVNALTRKYSTVTRYKHAPESLKQWRTTACQNMARFRVLFLR